ncbi:regulatory LuxR family protein [Mumia flava]|uniref:Regulatory LuxR family protein n=1 Tax=Mumia flava TaxID=1348852 RepID=A0A2M9BF97_9ACTN|nr:helix-turn-helix transcriptional regulator [Mumia flava]PJJ56612.1 regulatory LuxR family protein [Mumia flava]
MEAEELLSVADTRAAEGDYAGALAAREQAYTRLRQAGETRSASRLAAYQIAFDHLALFGNKAVAQGWLERGIRLASASGDCAEAGWVALARALHAADTRERDRWTGVAERAAATFGDADLGFDALAYRGLATVERGRVGRGMRLLDEAVAAAYSGEVTSPVVAGEIFCKLMVACEQVLDVPRAEEWHRVVTLLEQRLDLAWASAICRMHVGAVWTVAGRWDEAERELARAIELYDATYRALRPAACARMAELRVRQGRLEEAERHLQEGREDGFASRPAARLAWRQAVSDIERRAAAAALSDAIRPRRDEPAVIPELALLVELKIACNEPEDAATTAARLTEVTTHDVGAALTAYARLAEGQVAASRASPDTADLLREAVRRFARARLPLEQATTGVALAEVLAESDPASALAECRAAAEILVSLDARSETDRASAVLRRLGGRGVPEPRATGVLTHREREVLSLVASGLTNPEIAERLFLSRKTVAHHVSNVLAKLGVRNRGEAAALWRRHDEPHEQRTRPLRAPRPPRSSHRPRRSS